MTKIISKLDPDKWNFSKPLKFYQKILFIIYTIIGTFLLYISLVIGCCLF